MSREKYNKESNNLKLSTVSFFVRFGAYFFLEEERRVEGPTLYGNTMQAHRRRAQFGACDMRHDLRRRRTSKSGNLLSVMKFLYGALSWFSPRAKLRTSPRFMHGLSQWNRFSEPLTSSMFFPNTNGFHQDYSFPQNGRELQCWWPLIAIRLIVSPWWKQEYR